MGLLDNIDPLSLMAGGVTMMANSRGRNSRQAIPMGLDAFTQYQMLAQKQKQEEEDRKQKQAMFDANMELHKMQLEKTKAKDYIKFGKSLLDPDTLKPVLTDETIDPAKYAMQPRIGINPKTNKPEFVQFSDMHEPRWTGIIPTKDEIEIQKLKDSGVLPPDYAGGIPTPQPQQNNAPQSVPASPSPMPTNNFSTPYGVTWSGKTATDIAEGTSPDMQLKPILPPASRRKLAEKQGEANIDLAKEKELTVFKNKAELDKSNAEASAKKSRTMEGIKEVTDRARVLLNSNPTHSSVGSGVDSVAGFFGVSTDGASKAAALDAIAGNLVSKMPRMEGPQSDKDTDNYKAMAGRVGDRTLPVEQRLAALDEVERLYTKYDKGGVTAPAKPSKGDVVKGYRFKGGDPANRLNWEKL